MTTISRLNRRQWLKVSAIAGGGLMLRATLPASAAPAHDNALVGSKELNVYVQIDRDGQVTIYSSIPEMGQGIKTTLPMIIAEEMGARWEDVKVLDAPVDADRFGRQSAGRVHVGAPEHRHHAACRRIRARDAHRAPRS
ncbi:MAG: molybdopterin-dependent oxidoreductase [Gammaproteobacteria bacterium]|nr:molybdopterin-dependent oxidoreductase [Gammaproteobacteria bacterium]